MFRFGTTVFALRGQVLTTYTTNDVGNLTIARQDFIASMAGRETEGGAAFNNGFLFLSSEAGLEVYDLRNVRAGGNAPILLSRTANLHYRRIAVSGNRLAGLYPSTDLPCYPTGSSLCANAIDIVDISTLSSPTVIGSIPSTSRVQFRGFNDIAFNQGYLIAVAEGGLNAIDITDPAAPVRLASVAFPGKWLVSNGTDTVFVGNDTTVEMFAVRPGTLAFFTRTRLLTAPLYLSIDRGNAIRFNRNAFYDDANGRLVTMIDEIDPQTLYAARTIAFDVYDLSVPQFEGDVERIYEDVTMTVDDERKFNPVAVGPYVYVIGERTGLQSWGACDLATGRIELDSILHLVCGGTEIHGWVTGTQKVVNVEIFLDGASLGAATLGGPERNDVSSTTPVSMWRLNVNLDQTARGEHLLRAIATDALGNRRQFASQRIFFPGPGQNCVTPRRRAVR